MWSDIASFEGCATNRTLPASPFGRQQPTNAFVAKEMPTPNGNQSMLTRFHNVIKTDRAFEDLSRDDIILK
jgi:hypothetical protein